MKDQGESAVAVSELSDVQLNEAIAEAMGWHYVATGRDDTPDGECHLNPFPLHSADGHWHSGDHQDVLWPQYATSLDALAEVEARLREAGCFKHTDEFAFADGARGETIEWFNEFDDRIAHIDARQAIRNHAEAAYQALIAIEALNSPTPTAKGDV